MGSFWNKELKVALYGHIKFGALGDEIFAEQPDEGAALCKSLETTGLLRQ
jgi:hypothetical protein